MSEIKVSNVERELPEQQRSSAEAAKEFSTWLREMEGKRWPHFKFIVFYSPHVTEVDVQGLEPYLKRCDIFIPEMLGWTAEMLRDLRKISKDKSATSDLEELPAFGKMLKTFAGSGKAVSFIDVPANHPLFQQAEQSLQETSVSGDWDRDVIPMARKVISSGTAILDAGRENYMLAHLQPCLQEIIRQNAMLKKKSDLEVLMFLGSAHTGIYHFLKDAGVDIQRHFSRSPDIFLHSLRTTRGFRFGKEVKDDQLARHLLSYYVEKKFEPRLLSRVPDTMKRYEFYDLIADAFSIEEIKQMFNLSGPKLISYFYQKLEEKGIKLPSTEAELDAALFFDYSKKRLDGYLKSLKGDIETARIFFERVSGEFTPEEKKDFVEHKMPYERFFDLLEAKRINIPKNQEELDAFLRA